MPPVLSIKIGSSPIPSRKINVAVMEKVIRDRLDLLGMDVDVQIALTDHIDFLIINNYTCHYPESLVSTVDSCIQFWEKAKGKNSGEKLFWELLVSEILWMHAPLLFPDESLVDLMPALKDLPDDPHEIFDECKAIVHELLNLRISIRDKATINEISSSYLVSSDVEWNEFRENLIETLKSPVVSIFFNPDYFDQVITGKGNDNLFGLLRDGLFYESGIKYPSFKLEFDPELPYNAYYFQFNSYTCIPQIGLQDHEEILVNDTPERLLLLGITGKETVNPANGNMSSIINRLDKEKAEAAGLTTWNGLGYFILGFSGILRRYGYLCISNTLTSQYLDTLKLVFPKIIELIENAYLLSLCTKTLRLLAKEEISIRNLRVILEGILESDYIMADANQYIIFDERIPVQHGATAIWKIKAENVVEFVRIRLKKYISHKYTRGQSTLMVYLLDPEIEKMADPVLNPIKSFNSDTISKILKAVENELDYLPRSSQVPVILTSVHVRQPIKKIIEMRYPQVAVLSYQELSTEMNIQPIARISLTN